MACLPTGRRTRTSQRCVPASLSCDQKDCWRPTGGKSLQILVYQHRAFYGTLLPRGELFLQLPFVWRGLRETRRPSFSRPRPPVRKRTVRGNQDCDRIEPRAATYGAERNLDLRSKE